MGSLDNSDIKKLTNLTTAIGSLAEQQEGLDKLATSMGVLATNIGALSTNLKALDTTNLARVTVAAGEYQKRYGKYGVSGTPTPTGANTTTAIATPNSTSQYSEEEWKNIAKLISDQLSASFKNKPFVFKFASDNSGVMQM